MSSESPPTLRESLSSRTGIAVVVLFVLFGLYAVLIRAQILAIVYLASVALLLWLLYRFVRAHERIAVAQERRAAVVAGDGAEGRPSRTGVDRPASGVPEASDQPDREDDRE
ncbi:hypothetical protein [Halobaculum sp. EA56]|uniref:hypothetical protein n=1 Tax=Halobaculum sp. EA56 TaxID=3421648 RepID=UPI003EB89E47